VVFGGHRAQLCSSTAPGAYRAESSREPA
jgi:hypothetical protein